MQKPFKTTLILLIILVSFWMIAEIGGRMYPEIFLKTGFYGSMPRHIVNERLEEIGIQTASGPGWTYLGWIADPEHEDYRVVKLVDGEPRQVGKIKYGSFLLREASGAYQVWVIPNDAVQPRILDTVMIETTTGNPALFKPKLTSPWKTLFRPEKYGSYINDHTVFQDNGGDWRLVGITSLSDGDFNDERYFAVGVSPDFPPTKEMVEQEPVADFGELAWAPVQLQ